MGKVVFYTKKYCLWIIFGICLMISVFIAEDVFEADIMKIDVLAYNFFVATIRTDFLTKIMLIITKFGNATTLLILVFLFIFLFKNKKNVIAIICNLGLITVINQSLKFVVQRPRPDGYRLIKESGYSFPSGHSMVSVAFYGYLIYLSFKYIKNKTLKYIVCCLLVILILLIGISRIYLGVHYASDVIGGALISISYLIIYINVINRYMLSNN